MRITREKFRGKPLADYCKQHAKAILVKKKTNFGDIDNCYYCSGCQMWDGSIDLECRQCSAFIYDNIYSGYYHEMEDAYLEHCNIF